MTIKDKNMQLFLADTVKEVDVRTDKVSFDLKKLDKYITDSLRALIHKYQVQNPIDDLFNPNLSFMDLYQFVVNGDVKLDDGAKSVLSHLIHLNSFSQNIIDNWDSRVRDMKIRLSRDL
jgi:hypothetical protein